MSADEMLGELSVELSVAYVVLDVVERYLFSATGSDQLEGAVRRSRSVLHLVRLQVESMTARIADVRAMPSAE